MGRASYPLEYTLCFLFLQNTQHNTMITMSITRPSMPSSTINNNSNIERLPTTFSVDAPESGGFIGGSTALGLRVVGVVGVVRDDEADVALLSDVDGAGVVVVVVVVVG